MNKDAQKPISFKTIQKNKKLGDFVAEQDAASAELEEKLGR